jgi:hypothetical protein
MSKDTPGPALDRVQVTSPRSHYWHCAEPHVTKGGSKEIGFFYYKKSDKKFEHRMKSHPSSSPKRIKKLVEMVLAKRWWEDDTTPSWNPWKAFVED